MTLGRGYPIAGEALDRDLYRLLCVFAASRRVAHLSRKYSRLEDLIPFEGTEASQLLISLAVILRNNIDSGVVSWSQRLAKDVVGTLRPDVSKPRKVIPLPFREACNKIIHADIVDLWPFDKHR